MVGQSAHKVIFKGMKIKILLFILFFFSQRLGAQVIDQNMLVNELQNVR